MQDGLSGKIAGFFINSKLTILLMVALMIIGVYSSFLIPREEEPQINVPMADILIGYPGATPAEVENNSPVNSDANKTNNPVTKSATLTRMNADAKPPDMLMLFTF